MTLTFLSIRTRSAAVINLTGILEKAEESLLPAMYKYISKDFHASPSEMGAITVCRGLTKALTSPIGGGLGSMTNRIRVIMLGCLIWASMTCLFGTSRWAPNPYVMGAIVWALNGFGLALVVPNSRSVIADYYPADARGRAFGLWLTSGSIGAVFGSLFATSVSGWNSHALRGWQVVMFTLACLSAAIGWMNIHFARDPRDEAIRSTLQATTEEEQRLLREMESDESESSSRKSWSYIRAAILAIFQIPTFRIIILQGIVGSMPWKALTSFMILYFQLIGMSDIQAAVLASVFLLGTATGYWIGGVIGDRASLLLPNHGRIAVSQFSVASGIPLMILIFRGLPKNGDDTSAVLYALALFTTGTLISWAAPACNSPIYAEIVHPDMRNIIYSLDGCLEDALSSPASFLTGFAAERIWGFEGEATSTEDVTANLEKAEALSKALTLFSVVPWTLCFFAYIGLHFTLRGHVESRQLMMVVEPVSAISGEWHPSCNDDLSSSRRQSLSFLSSTSWSFLSDVDKAEAIDGDRESKTEGIVHMFDSDSRTFLLVEVQ